MVAVIDPLFDELHDAFVTLEVMVICVGCNKLIDWLVIQPLLISVTLILYVPVFNPEAVVVAPTTTDAVAGFHVKVNGPVPVAVAVADPFAPPKQVIEVEVTLTVGPAGFDNDVTKLFVQPAPSITRNVYVPAPNELAVVTGPATTDTDGGVQVNV